MITPLPQAAAGLLALACAWALGHGARPAEDHGALRIAIVHEPSSPPGVLAGIRFGTAEVGHTARLVGRELRVVPPAADRDAQARIETSRDGVSIASSARGGTGRSSCRLHLRPSEQERRAALDGWRPSAATAPPGARVVEWHPTLVKFGAAQLNERFARATRSPMSADAWIGWLAVKALGDAMLRTTNADLCGTLRRRPLDGHKGQPLRFDDATGRLRQPLYIATETTVLAEVSAP